jgi:hypothetical protein
VNFIEYAEVFVLLHPELDLVRELAASRGKRGFVIAVNSSLTPPKLLSALKGVATVFVDI